MSTTPQMSRERTNKVMLTDEELILLKPLMDAYGLSRVSAVAFLIRNYTTLAINNKPK